MRFTLVLLFLFMLTTSGFGDFYQYTDDTGVTIFTDDVSQIPADQRTAAQKIKTASEGGSSQKIIKEQKQQGVVGKTKENTTDKDVRVEWLNKEKHELDIIYENLIKRREALKKEEKTVLPGEASVALKKKADLLNQDIIAFDLRRKAFNIKVETFNKKNAQ